MRTTHLGQRSKAVMAVGSIVGGAALTAACLVHNSLPEGCIGNGCNPGEMRGTTTLTSTLFVLAGIMLGLCGAGVLRMVRQRRRGLGATGVAAGLTGVIGLGLLLASAVVMRLDGNWGGMPALVVPGVVLVAVGSALCAVAGTSAGTFPAWWSVILGVTALLLPLANEQTSRILLGVPFGLTWAIGGLLALMGAGESRRPSEESQAGRPAKRPQLLVLGGGYVGLYTALRLKKRLRAQDADITVVDPRSYMTYQPFLPEAAAGSLEPRHVVVPLRRELRGIRVLNARVLTLRQADRIVTVGLETGAQVSLRYDHVVLALGSVARTLPVPGLSEVGMGFKHVEEAIALRNHVLERLDLAASSSDVAARQRALSFVFVGGGYAGTEALAEVEDMARSAVSCYEGLRASDLRFVMVEASDRILPEVSPTMSSYAVRQLRSRGIDVRLETRLVSCVAGDVLLSDGTTLQADTVVWTAGVRANPVLEGTDLPLDDRGRLRCNTALQAVSGDSPVPGVWGAGDCAAVPDLTAAPGALCAPSAQHAVRQARLLGDNIVAVLRGRAPLPYRHRHAGSVASLGLYKGVGHVYGLNVKGFPAWVMHRTYHLMRVPTLNRKIRIVLDWTLALLFRRELVALGRLQHPRAEFLIASRQAVPSSPSGGLAGLPDPVPSRSSSI